MQCMYLVQITTNARDISTVNDICVVKLELSLTVLGLEISILLLLCLILIEDYNNLP